MPIGCILQAHHKLPQSPFDNEPLDSPQAIERLKQGAAEIEKALIVTISISELQAAAIVKRIWPKEALLEATCGRGFFIEDEHQASIVNDVLSPDIHIRFDLEKHQWMIQTWPESSQSSPLP